MQKQFHDVVVSTYGRGIYVLDDITPLEQGVADDDRRGESLYAARPPTAGRSAVARYINYSLQSGAARPRAAADPGRRTARSSAICVRPGAPA